MYRAAMVFLAMLTIPGTAPALGPHDVFLLVNKNMPESQRVAEHYCQRRGVPKDHIVPLNLPKGESISRDDFNNKLRDPLREALKKRRDKVKVLLSIYGVPLRVGADQPTAAERKQLTEVRKKLTELQAEAKKLKEDKTAKKEYAKLQAQIRGLRQTQRRLSHAESVACVDSELMLLWWKDFPLQRWQPNLLNFRMPEKLRQTKPPVLMTARLDGPSAKIAMRLVDDAIEVEKKGLRGKVYVDARGIKWNKKKTPGYGYGGYDESLREMAALLETKAKLPVVLDDKSALFPSKSCPDAALYCGWYSLAKYVDCCQFTKGAVAYHIASSEAVSLRRPNARYWCPNLLKDGVCATLGPVAEPYTVGFPKPAEFFGFLVTGEYTLVECYSKTMYLNSWMTVLVGDPLYSPFAHNKRMQVGQVQPSPEGCAFLFQVQSK